MKYELEEKFWLKYFNVYDALVNLIPYQNVLEDIISLLPSKNLKILETGCGTGNLIFYIADNVKYKRLVGVDYSLAALTLANKKIENRKNIIFKYADIRQHFVFKDEEFEVIVMNNVLYTLPVSKRQDLIHEVYRMLKPGGIFILSNINIHFKPMLIYKTHILKSIKKKGFIVTITQVFQLIYPTVMIFYYNFLIKKSNKGGLYDFIKQGEQADLLRNSKFKININDKLTYAGSAFLSKGTK